MPKLALDWRNVLTSKVPKNTHVSMEHGARSRESGGWLKLRQQNSTGLAEPQKASWVWMNWLRWQVSMY
ncbi:MAG: hypothetical protein ACOX4C_02485 [Bacillota bacterium]